MNPPLNSRNGHRGPEAADQEAALALAEGHPHLNRPGGCTIEVHAAQPVPGM